MHTFDWVTCKHRLLGNTEMYLTVPALMLRKTSTRLTMLAESTINKHSAQAQYHLHGHSHSTSAVTDDHNNIYHTLIFPTQRQTVLNTVHDSEDTVQTAAAMPLSGKGLV